MASFTGNFTGRFVGPGSPALASVARIELTSRRLSPLHGPESARVRAATAPLDATTIQVRPGSSVGKVPSVIVLPQYCGSTMP